MSTFKFNFSGEDDAVIADRKDSLQWMESEEILPGDLDLDDKVSRAKMFTCGDVEIGHVILNDALASIAESTIGKEQKNGIIADKEQSDLIAGAYEGGLKIWECTYDLIEYMDKQTDVSFEDKLVLDLGCGAGILGIYAMLKGSRVVFQDYNSEVLEHVTIPNVLLNIEEESERKNEIKKCQFFSGDWASFNKILPDITFDIILTSETIYNENNYDKLIDIFTKRLNRDGIVLVAAKTHYFGVGGGLKQFEKAIQKNGELISEVIWQSTGGIQREILKIRHK